MDLIILMWWMFVCVSVGVTHFFPLSLLYYPRLPTDKYFFHNFHRDPTFPQFSGKIKKRPLKEPFLYSVTLPVDKEVSQHCVVLRGNLERDPETGHGEVKKQRDDEHC